MQSSGEKREKLKLRKRKKIEKQLENIGWHIEEKFKD